MKSKGCSSKNHTVAVTGIVACFDGDAWEERGNIVSSGYTCTVSLTCSQFGTSTARFDSNTDDKKAIKQTAMEMFTCLTSSR